MKSLVLYLAYILHKIKYRDLNQQFYSEIYTSSISTLNIFQISINNNKNRNRNSAYEA